MEDLLITAAEANNINVLSWLLKNGCSWTDLSFAEAIEKYPDNIALYKLISYYGCKFTESAQIAAVVTCTPHTVKMLNTHLKPVVEVTRMNK
jgi:hypothetical protein